MTINAGAPSTSPVYVGTGTETLFAFPFTVDSALDVRVLRNGSVVPPTGYTVNVGARTVTMVTPLVSGATLQILDLPQLSQGRDYTNQGGVPPEDVERALDKLTRIARALQRDKLSTRPALPVFTNNTAAIAGGLAVDDVYRTPSGEWRSVV